MAGYFLSEQELQLLRGVPELVSRLYVMQLRPRMNIRTKRVGEPPHTVTWSSLARFLSVDPAPGVKAVDFSAQQIRRACAQLQKLGLAELCSEGRQLLIELPHAVVFCEADSIENAKAGTLFVVKADRLKSMLPAEIYRLFGDIDEKADILISTKPDSIHAAKPDSLTRIDPKPDSKETDKSTRGDKEKTFIDQCNTGKSAIGETEKPTDNPTDIINTLPNRTLPNHFIAHAIDAEPILRWRKFFKQQGFDGRRLSTGLAALYEDWDRRGITEQVVLVCIEIAKERLGRLPDTPDYLREIVDEYVERDNHAKVTAHLNGYDAPLDSLRVFVVNDRVWVLAPSPAEAEQCFRGRYQSDDLRSVRALDRNDSFYAGSELGEITVRDVAALWLRDGKRVPAILGGLPNA